MIYDKLVYLSGTEKCCLILTTCGTDLGLLGYLLYFKSKLPKGIQLKIILFETDKNSVEVEELKTIKNSK